LGAMVLNLSANILGLGNAATPFGIRAMQELNRLNPQPGVASPAMILFLALNTASITILPTKVIALRAASGSADPAAVIPTTLFATLAATLAGVAVAKLWPRRPVACEFASPPLSPPPETGAPLPEVVPNCPLWGSVLALGLVVAIVPLTLAYGRQVSPWVLPGLVVAMLGFGLARGVRVYEVFVEGAREGFEVAVRIIPYLVAILVAIGMLRASGAMDLLITPLGRLTAPAGLPPEALTMAVMRTLSGSGSYGLLADILKNPATGPDTYIGLLASTIYGSTETTFYVLAVYFGAVGVRDFRHAVWVGLLADLAALVAAVAICGWKA
ncbi:MAG: spore maturation protein, partial [Rhodospirillales bacterium]|nr:spore maturation protein [Rhodospirillales bacterium]